MAPAKNAPPLGRLHVVAWDLAATSPAQPRVAALVRTLVRLGTDVTVWTENEPGAWVGAVTGAGRVTVRVVADPVHRTYRWLGGLVGPAVAAPPPAPAFAAGPATSARPTLARRLWRLGSQAQHAFLFPDLQRWWASRVQSRLRGALRPDDVVLTCSRPESALLVGAAAQRRGARWWADFADGWCFQGLRAEALAPGARRERECALERRLVAAADVVSTVNDELAGYFGELRPGRPVALYPNIVPDEFAELSLPPPNAGRPRPTLGYFGRLSLSDPERSLAPLLDVLRADARTPAPARARFCFLGTYSPRDRAEIAELQRLGHEVDVAPPLSRERLAERCSEFDGMVVLTSPSQRGTSSKLLDSLGLGLPVLAFAPVPSAAHALIAETGCGEVIEIPGAPDPDRWRRFLRGLHGADYRVEPRVRARFTSASLLPSLLEKITAWLHAPPAPR